MPEATGLQSGTVRTISGKPSDRTEFDATNF